MINKQEGRMTMKKGKSWVIILFVLACVGLLGWYSTQIITDTKDKQEATANGESSSDNKYQNMLSQINNELSSKRDLFNTLSGLLTQRKQLEENIRQANAEMAYKREQLAYQKQRDAIADQQWQKEYNAKYGSSSSNSLSNSSYVIGSEPAYTY